MQMIISGHKVKLTKPMKEYAANKIGKLTHYFENIQKIEVILDPRKTDDATRREVAEVTVWAAGKKVIRASEAAQDMYSAIDLVFAELEKQLKKHKEKHVKETRRTAEKIKERTRITPPSQGRTGDIAIVQIDRFADKPMSPDEAKDEVSALKQEFLMFMNPDTGMVNLAYKRGKEVNILEPEENEMKAFTPEEAADAVGSDGNDFIMFKNKETDKINVLFRRHSGNFGLIEPRA